MSPGWDLLVAATALAGAAAMWIAYKRSGDSLHPLLIACPIGVFVYAAMPWMLRRHDTVSWYVGPSDLERAQAVFLVLFVAFCAGALLASGRARWSPDAPVPAPGPAMARRLVLAACVLGGIGLLAWAMLIVAEGGLVEVYDQPHGGDVLHPSGWVRESTRLALVGALLVLAASQARWARLAAVGFAFPHIVHAALGTRRGPAFVTAVFLAGSYYLFSGRRPRVVVSLVGGTALGLVLLFLLANRWRLYYGSAAELNYDITDSVAFYPNPNNDYLVAAGLVTAADRSGTFGWGVSYAEQLFVRPIPRSVLPDKYDLLQEETVGAEEIGMWMGWRPPPGWVPTLFAHLYLEFWWLALPLSGLLGWAYGYVWRRSQEAPTHAWLAARLIMLAGLLHLIAQEFWAMAVPFLLMYVPAWAALRWAAGRAR